MTQCNGPDARWTLSFYQDKGGYREIKVIAGPCLVGNSKIEVVPATELERLRNLLRRSYGAHLSIPGNDAAVIEDLRREFGGTQ